MSARAIAAALVAILAGCAPEYTGACFEPAGEPHAQWPTPELALDVWAGPVTERCRAEVDRVRWVRLTEDQMPMIHGKGGYFSDCAQEHAPMIAVVDGYGTPRNVAHELAHWLFSCSGLGAGDWNHDVELFADTVEGVLAANRAAGAYDRSQTHSRAFGSTNTTSRTVCE